MSKAKTVTLEAIQFVPILTLASSFVVTGEVVLERAGVLFLTSGGLALLFTAIVFFQKCKLNPVLLGTNLWLVVGAVAFGASIEPLMDITNQLRATGLFACILGVGVILAMISPGGFASVDTTERRKIHAGSAILLALTAAALLWSMFMADNIRLGGGLPFILLNISRRVLVRRLSDKKSP